jgi:hypothetical protein
MKFWSFFSTYFFNSTYTRVDLYASIYGILNIDVTYIKNKIYKNLRLSLSIV